MPRRPRKPIAPAKCSPLIEEMKRETPPGRCIACDEPLPPNLPNRRARVICDSVACHRLYHAAYKMGWRAFHGRH